MPKVTQVGATAISSVHFLPSRMLTRLNWWHHWMCTLTVHAPTACSTGLDKSSLRLVRISQLRMLEGQLLWTRAFVWQPRSDRHSLWTSSLIAEFGVPGVHGIWSGRQTLWTWPRGISQSGSFARRRVPWHLESPEERWSRIWETLLVLMEMDELWKGFCLKLMDVFFLNGLPLKIFSKDLQGSLWMFFFWDGDSWRAGFPFSF